MQLDRFQVLLAVLQVMSLQKQQLAPRHALQQQQLRAAGLGRQLPAAAAAAAQQQQQHQVCQLDQPAWLVTAAPAV